MRNFVQIIVRTADGATHERNYAVPTPIKETDPDGQASFREWALGNLISLVVSGTTNDLAYEGVICGSAYGIAVDNTDPVDLDPITITGYEVNDVWSIPEEEVI